MPARPHTAVRSEVQSTAFQSCEEIRENWLLFPLGLPPRSPLASCFQTVKRFPVTAAEIAHPPADRAPPSMVFVLAASCAGTIFEWYDFFVFGSLAAIIGAHFYAGAGAAQGYVFALLTFAAGFAVRPFGALVFGRFGDRNGRKRAFLVTITIMGLATVLVGLLPDYSSIGIAAPYALVAMRILQGFAIGGEYGGAAIYVAEHAARNRRGAATGWIQTAAPIGPFLALGGILVCRSGVGEAAFRAGAGGI